MVSLTSLRAVLGGGRVLVPRAVAGFLPSLLGPLRLLATGLSPFS